MSHIHLICGRLGAGKTTYAKAQAVRLGLPFLNLDEWMATLFAPDAGAGKAGGPHWTDERLARCEAQIWRVAGEILRSAPGVVLEIGLSKKSRRDEARARARALGAEVTLHYLDAPEATRLARVRARNSGQGGTFTLAVDDVMFYAHDLGFEPLTDDERSSAVVVTG